MNRIPCRRNAVVVAILLGMAAHPSAHANGLEFFKAQQEAKLSAESLVYVGMIRDTDGKPVDDVRISILVSNVGTTISGKNDQLGHYKSTDIGAWVARLGGKIDPAFISIAIQKPGYILARPAAIPRKTSGVHHVDLVLKKQE